VYALENIIGEYGLVQKGLAFLGLIHGPMHVMHSQAAVYIGIVYSYLPYMILPLYAMLEKMDSALLEAAADLGARPFQRFLDVTLPLSLPGILAGSMLVLIPAIGEFVIPSLLGGPNSLMIGRVLWDEFFANHDWPVASAVATAFLILVAGPIALYQHLQMQEQAA
jgi:putrescine transport system permease protein